MKNKTFKFFSRANEQEHVPSKYDANLRKNGFLNFQIGLIISMLMVYGVFQIQFPNDLEEVAVHIDQNDDLIDDNFDDFVVVQQPTSAPVTPTPVVPPVSDVFIEVDNDPDIIEQTQVIATTEDHKDDPINVNDLRQVGEDDMDITDIPSVLDINAVEKVPVFPGCEKLDSNEEKTACLAAKIKKVIQKNFDGGMASEYGLSGVQRIYVQFKIDENGEVSDVKARAPHNALAAEANRVIHKIPKMTPGKQQNKNVSVRYSVPIIFSVN